MLRKLALALAAAALSLLAVELAVRVLDLRISSLHRGLLKLAALEVLDTQRNLLTASPGVDTLLFGHETHFNSLGVRDREPELPKPRGRFRIMLLGDSMVFGQGVAERDTVGEVLRTRLAGPRVDVVSAGIPGWNTLSEEQFLDKTAKLIEPDLVVLLYVENDNEPNDPFVRARQDPHGLGDALYRALLVRSRTFEWAAYVYRSRIAGADPAVGQQAARWGDLVAAQGPSFAPHDPGWIASSGALTRMAQALAQRRARLVVFLFDLGTIAPTAQIHARLAEFERSSGVAVFETRSFFGGRVPAALMNAPLVDPHPNAIGHQLLGEGIARTLQERGLLPR
ncbi:MAG: hypothetical protein HY899_03165 [Deltaproteobacteria bacterium]|nr:hypothetical protein [Deltaproteobacteria bacterium]